MGKSKWAKSAHSKTIDGDQVANPDVEIEMDSESIPTLKEIEQDIISRLNQDWISVGGENAAIRMLEETVYTPGTPDNEKFYMILAKNFQILYLVQKTPKLGRLLKLLPFKDLYHIDLKVEADALVVNAKSYYHDTPNLTSKVVAETLVKHLENVDLGKQEVN